MLTHWVGQAWREFHKKNPGLIRKTFRKLGLSLAIDGSEDDELWVKNIPDVEVGDWRRYDEEDEVASMHSAEMEDPTNEIDQDGENEAIREMEYVLNGMGGDEVENEKNRNSDNELENDEQQ